MAREIKKINIKQLQNNDFKKEKDLVNYICRNIDSFTRDILEDELIYFEIDKPIDKKYKMDKRSRRIDIFIKCKNKTYIIETKNPTGNTENRSAIGQVLDYGKDISDPKKELIIITSKFDYDTAETIKHYNLPIRYMYISKEYMMEGLNE